MPNFNYIEWLISAGLVWLTVVGLICCGLYWGSYEHEEEREERRQRRENRHVRFVSMPYDWERER